MRRTASGWLTGLGLAAVSVLGVQSGARTPAPVTIQLDTPTPGELVRSRVNLARVRGSAHSGNGEPVDFEVLVVLDVSRSTSLPSGIDVDGDGELGFNPREELVAPGTYPPDMVCTDPGDTILAAEIKAARALLQVLVPGRTRLGVIAFSGAVDQVTGKRLHPDQRDAELLAPLTENFARLDAVLDGIARRGPSGATNFAAAVHLAVSELAGMSGARSTPRPGARKVALLLTDGIPTFPFGVGTRSDPADVEAAIDAARLARKAGVTINTYALGRQALSQPVAATELARITGGAYTPVRKPGDIVSFLQGVSFANVEDVVIANLTTREVSYDVSLSPDGSFSGVIPVSVGPNRVLVTALASDGGESSVELSFLFEKSGLTERELERELGRIRRRNKQLMLLRERDRIKRFRERQRRRIVIEADDLPTP